VRIGVPTVEMGHDQASPDSFCKSACPLRADVRTHLGGEGPRSLIKFGAIVSDQADHVHRSDTRADRIPAAAEAETKSLLLGL
jgi:hypothetical protein